MKRLDGVHDQTNDLQAADGIDCGNMSLSFGVTELVRKGFHRLRLNEFLDGFKEKGVPLGYVVEQMCIHQLNGGASMNRCEEFSSSPLAKESSATASTSPGRRWNAHWTC